jgi:trk system potassium uptake protein TrkA
MRICIGGEDHVAFRLAEALMADHSVVLLLPDEVRDPVLERLDVQVAHGSITAGDALIAAGAPKADLFVACTGVDERNLVACVEAKRLGAQQVTCFLRSHNAQSNESDAVSLARSLGIDSVILPAARLAKEILKIVMVPGALDAEAFEGGRVRLVKKRIEAGAQIASAPLKELGVPKGVVLVMGQRGDETFIPSGDTRFEPGDKVTAMGDTAGMNRFLTKYLESREGGRDLRRATVVGGGVVGIAVARGLEEAGWNVKVIEADADRAAEIAPLLNSLVLHGDGTDLELLREERIGDDAVLIAVTSNDEKNLLVSLLARQQGIPRIITRADKPANERLFEAVGIDVVRSAIGAAVSTVVRRANRTDRDVLAEFEHGDVRLVRLEVPEGFPPTPLGELKAPVFAIVGAVLRAGGVLIPHGADPIQGGDQLLVFCRADGLEETRRFFARRTRPE